MGLPRFTTRRWMAIVLYAALDLASLHALASWGMEPAVWVVFVLNVVIPLGMLGWWVFRHVRPNTLY
jgi:hypothetical protein